MRWKTEVDDVIGSGQFCRLHRPGKGFGLCEAREAFDSTKKRYYFD